MKLHQLNLLCALEQYRSFSKTAQHLFLSQPALSSSIQSLEKELQCTLLMRSNRGVQFTHAGKLALEIAHDIQNEIVLIRALARDGGRLPEHMAIASNTLTCIDLLARVYMRSEEAQAPVTIHFREIDEHTLIHQLLYGTLDFALLQLNAVDVETDRIALMQKHGITLLELKREPIVVLVRRDHPLAKQRQLPIAALFAYRFITAHLETDQRLITHLQAFGYDQQPMLVEDSACLNQLIATSDYWAFVSESESVRHRLNADDRFNFLRPVNFSGFCSINWVRAHPKYPSEEKNLLQSLQQILTEQEVTP